MLMCFTLFCNFHESIPRLPDNSRHLVVTTCTNRKRIAVSGSLLGRVLKSGNSDEVAQDWGRLLEKSKSVVPAKDLYSGRAFREAERAATELDARLFFVSAGLGLVSGDTIVPSYGLTLSRGAEDSVLMKTNQNASAWWDALTAISVFHEELPETDGLILVAVSQPYLEMIGGTLSNWSDGVLSKVRLFVKRNPATTFPKLEAQWMPYDDRLDLLVPDFAGTQSDFAQRAMRHFACAIAAKPGTAKQHTDRVERALSGLTIPDRPNRKKMTDEDLSKTIEENWEAAEGRSGQMLRILRDRLGIACEQGRFKTLFATVRQARQRQL